mgnify:FL=1
MDRKEKQLRYCEAGLFAEKVLALLDHGLSRYTNIDRLRRGGVHVLSSGAYGTTMLSPDGSWVLKVCWDKQDAYPIYARWAAANPGPHIPDIFYHVQTEHVFICAMPRYYETKEDSYDYLSACRESARYDAPQDNDPSLTKALRDMLEALEDFCSTDLHFGNFMYDPKRRQYVVTDPFSSLCCDPDKAVARVTGKDYREPLREQLDIFDCAPELPTAGDLSYLEHVCQVVGQKIQRAPFASALQCDFASLELRVAAAFGHELIAKPNGVIKV